VVSQVVAKCLYDDTDDFSDEFYKCLTVLNDELFFACNSSDKNSEETKNTHCDVISDASDIKLRASEAETVIKRINEKRTEMYERAIAGDDIIKRNETDTSATSKRDATKQNVASLESKHPKLRGEGSSDGEVRDRINEEFAELARQAAGNPDEGLRNRMSNVYVKLSDTQQKLRRK